MICDLSRPAKRLCEHFFYYFFQYYFFQIFLGNPNEPGPLLANSPDDP